MSSVSKESLGIVGIDALHFFVRDLERSREHYVERLDFAEVAVSGARFEREQRARARLLEAGNVRFLFVEPLGSKGESFRWLERHPEGIARIALEVTDLEHTFALLLERGATLISGIERASSEGKAFSWFDIATAFGDTTMRFVQYETERALPLGLLRTAIARPRPNRFGIAEVDHLTSNFLTLKPALLWMQEVLGLERYWGIEFHTQDVQQTKEGGSGLKSVVMWDPHSGLKFANNEPAAPAFHASQIYKFCEEHRGAGVQHVALTVSDIVAAVRDMRQRGVPFMPTPSSYYDRLPSRLLELGVESVEEAVDELRALEILVDGDGPQRYLLQIFMREAAGLFGDTEAGPLFIELIQRKGDRGFGAGNFRALFESIERHQVRGQAA